MSKTADRLILRPISQDSPDSALTGGTPSEKMSKVVAPRDRKQLFGGILYGSCPVILFFFPLSFLFPLTNFFPLTISRPPRGYGRTKKVLHTFATAPFRHSSTYLLCSRLGIDPVDEARKGDRVPNMFKLTDPGHNPLQSHPEPRVRNATKLSQIQIPRVALRIQALLPDPRDKSIVILYPLPPTGNLTIAFWRQEIYR